MENKANSELRLRERYFLEKDRIRKDIGDLPQILEKLGLSQRKACQLLLVDPSAWTRWNKFGAPPHIYQALNWLLQLKQVNPAAVGPGDLSARIDQVQSLAQAKMHLLEQNLTAVEKALSLAAVHSGSSTNFSDSSFFWEREHELRQKIEALEMKIQELLKTSKATIKNPKIRAQTIQKKKKMTPKKQNRVKTKVPKLKRLKKKSSVKPKRKLKRKK